MLRAIPRDHVKAPVASSATGRPAIHAPLPKRTQGLTRVAAGKPLAVPVTVSVEPPPLCALRVALVMTMLPGVTSLDAADASLHPAPLRAWTVKVYFAPFVRPVNTHSVDFAPVRHVRPPGEAVTR